MEILDQANLLEHAYNKEVTLPNFENEAHKHEEIGWGSPIKKIGSILQHDFECLKACLGRDLFMSIMIGVVGTIVGSTAELLWFEHSPKMTSFTAESDCAGRTGKEYLKCIASDTTTLGKLIAQWTAVFFIPGFKSFSPTVKGWVGFIFMLAEMKLMSIFSMKLLLPIFKRISFFRYSPIWSHMYKKKDFEANKKYPNGNAKVKKALKNNKGKDMNDEVIPTWTNFPGAFAGGVKGIFTSIGGAVKATGLWFVDIFWPVKTDKNTHSKIGSVVHGVKDEIVSGGKTLIRAPKQSICFILCYLPVAAMYNFCWFCFHLGPDGGIFHSEFTMGRFVPEFIMGTGPLIAVQDFINWVGGAGAFPAATGPARAIEGFVMPASERLFWNVVQAVALSTGIFWFMREKIVKSVWAESKLCDANWVKTESASKIGEYIYKEDGSYTKGVRELKDITEFGEDKEQALKALQEHKEKFLNHPALLDEKYNTKPVQEEKEVEEDKGIDPLKKDN